MTAPRVASVPGPAAVWLTAKLHAAGVSGATVRADAERYRAAGYRPQADALEAGWSQLVAAADEHRDLVRAGGDGHRPPSRFPQEPASANIPALRAGSEPMSTGEAAAVLGITRQHVGRLARAGALDGHRVGRTWTVTRPSVEALAELRGKAS